MSTTPRTDALRDKLLQVIAAWTKGEIYAGDLQVAVEFHLKETSAMERELQQANAQIAALRGALEKIQGYGREDMGHQQMCDYVTETAEEALSFPAPAVVPLDDAYKLVIAMANMRPIIGHYEDEYPVVENAYKEMEAFRAKHPQKEDA